jgi:DNA-binding transcriptional LysR family regulator
MPADSPRRSVRLDELAVFVEVAGAGSLAAAARRLGVPKSTVGRAVARVEEDFGVPLVRRMARGQGLTEAGRRLATLATSHVGALRDLSAALVSDVSEPYGNLRITATADLATLVLGPLVAEFVQRHPSVSIELEATVRVVDLVREGFDLALRVARRGLPASALVAKKVARLESGLFAGPAYVARHGAPRRPDDLLRHEHVLMKAGDGKQVLALEPRDTPGRGTLRLTVHGRCSANDFFFLREVIAGGAGIGQLPWFMARADLAAGRLVRILPDYAVVGASTYLVHARATPLPVTLRAFRDFVLERAPGLLTQA